MTASPGTTGAPARGLTFKSDAACWSDLSYAGDPTDLCHDVTVCNLREWAGGTFGRRHGQDDANLSRPQSS